MWEKSWWVLLMVVASRLVIVAVIIYSRQVVTRGPFLEVSGEEEHGGTLLDILTQWDGTWYRYIAERGYASPMPAVATAFFPLYPLTVRAVTFVVRDLQLASVLVSNGCLIAAALLLKKLLRLDYDESVCRRAIVFVLFNPVSFFFSTAHTESMFLLLSVGALLAARQGRWLGSGVCGALLTATRPPGLLIAAPLLAEHLIQWRDQRGGVHRILQPRLLWLGLVPVGLALYFFYCYTTRGDWLAPIHAQAVWQKKLTWPWQSFLWSQNFSPAHLPLYQAIVAAGFALIGAAFFLRIRASYLVYAVVAILFYLAWGTLDALPRFLSVLFPIHLSLALVSTRWRWLYEPLLAFSVALLAYCTVLFANAYQMT
jgi:Gpi18-like mannosyltransferase